MSLFLLATKLHRSPLGIALVSLIFTSIIGGGIAYKYAQSQADSQRIAGERLVAAENRIGLTQATAKLLQERQIYAGMVASGISSKVSPADMVARWTSYQAAYVNYNTSKFNFRSSSMFLLNEHTSAIFSRTLDRNITASFARLDECLTRAYTAYDTMPAYAAAILQQCGKLGSTTAQARAADPSWTFGGQLRLLQTCIGSFDDLVLQANYLENRYDVLPDSQKRRLINMDADVDKALGRSGQVAVALACQPDDLSCARNDYYAKLPKKLAASCSALAKGKYRNWQLPPPILKVAQLN